MPPKRKVLSETTSNLDAPEKNSQCEGIKEVCRINRLYLLGAYTHHSKVYQQDRKQKVQMLECEHGKPLFVPRRGWHALANNQILTQLSDKPSYVNLEWPNIHEFLDDQDHDMPKDGEKLDGWIDRVSDLGIPISEYAQEMSGKMLKECEKRDQDLVGMHIYNDWNGWGISEVMENHLKDCDRDIFKKTISPDQKFAYVEAFACFVLMEDDSVAEWMGNENGPGICEIVNMIGVMVLTSLEMLAEHNLLEPNSDIKNLNIICLILLDFLNGIGSDLECEWDGEVVRLCDEAGIALENDVRKQLSITKEQITDMRAFYMKKKEASDLDKGGDLAEGNGYKAFARKEDWSPKDDSANDDCGGRLWYRWDWKLEYLEFKKNHPGGTRYVIGKMSKAAKKNNTL